MVVTDPGAARSLIDINGNISWTQGTGYIPITLKDSDGQILNLDLQDADYQDDTAFPMLSLCKLLKEDWKIYLTQDEPYDVTPSGDKIILFVGNDNVLRLPHGIREGDDTKQRASAAATAAHLKYCPVGMMDPSPASGQPKSYGASMAQFTEDCASSVSGTTGRSAVSSYDGSDDSATFSSCSPDTQTQTQAIKF